MAAAKNNSYVLNRKLRPQYTQAQIDDIITKLLEWAYASDEIYMAGFVYREYKRSKTWLYQLARAHKDVEEALETTRQLIANKIGNHSFLGDRNSTFGEKILPMYCKDFKALKEWQASLNKTQEKGDTLTIQDIIKLSKAGDLLKAMAQPDENKTS